MQYSALVQYSATDREVQDGAGAFDLGAGYTDKLGSLLC